MPRTLSMKLLLIAVFFLLFTKTMFAQFRYAVELTPFIRWDNYPTFNYFPNPVNKNAIKIKGESVGVNGAFKFRIQNSLFGKVGLGYYRYDFSQIENTNNYGTSSVRRIDYPSLFDPLFSTDKYWYDNIALSLGIEKYFFLSHGLQVNVGVSIANYYSYRQYYRVTVGPPTGPPNNDYTLHDNRYFGFSTLLQGGLTKQIGRVHLGPTVLLPVFDQWRKDQVFPTEENNQQRSKWSRGIGLGISAAYTFGK